MEQIQFAGKLRPFKESDIAFCRDSFFNGAAKSPEFKRMCENITKPGFRNRFTRFQKVSEIWLISSVDHDEPLFGWIAVTNLKNYSIVWWVYVKSGYKKLGFAKQLATKIKHPDNIVFPFSSRLSPELANKYKATFNPFVYEDLCHED